MTMRLLCFNLWPSILIKYIPFLLFLYYTFRKFWCREKRHACFVWYGIQIHHCIIKL